MVDLIFFNIQHCQILPFKRAILKSAEIEKERPQGPVSFLLETQYSHIAWLGVYSIQTEPWGLPTICMAQKYFPLIG